MLVLLENFFLLWGSFSWLMWVNYLENKRFLENYFCFSFFLSVMGGTSKLIRIWHLMFGFALTNVKFQVVQLLCSWMHSLPFSVEVLCSQNRLVVLRVCLLLAFIPFPGYLISVLSERESVGEREIASHSVCLCISVYLDLDSPFSIPLHTPCLLSPPKKTPKNEPKKLSCRKQSSFRQCLKCGGREDQQSWKLFLAGMGCCALGNSSSWARLLLFDCLKRRELTDERGARVAMYTCAVPSGSTAQTAFRLRGWGGWSHLSLKMGCSGSAQPQSWLVVRGAGRITLWALSIASCVKSDSPSCTPVLSLLYGWKTCVVI